MPDEIVVLVDQPIAPEELARLVELVFEDMVKYVVDLRLGVVAIGRGEALS